MHARQHPFVSPWLFGRHLPRTKPQYSLFVYMQERPEVLRQKLKHAINSAPLSEQQRQRLVTEHCLVFQLNSDIVHGFRIQWRSIVAGHQRALIAAVILFVVLCYVYLIRGN